jgi:hypothetical protein
MVTIDMLLFAVYNTRVLEPETDTRHDQCGGVTEKTRLVTCDIMCHGHTQALIVGAKLGNFKDVHPPATNPVSSLCAKSRLLFLNFGSYSHRTERRGMILPGSVLGTA